MKKIILILSFWAIYSNSLYAAKPLVGIVIMGSSNPRVLNISEVLKTHITNIISFTRIFDNINANLLKEELTKFNCVDEGCMLGFAKDAGLKLLIKGIIEDRGNNILIDLSAYGIGLPYFDKRVYRYKVLIPLYMQRLSLNEYSYIYEEHAARFISGLLNNYKTQVFLKKEGRGKILVDSENIIKGIYSLYRYKNIKSRSESIQIYNKIGKITVSENRGELLDLKAEDVTSDDFILISYENKASYINEFYYGRKKEIVIEDTSTGGAFINMLYTVPGSALMPVIAPIGYYTFGDFTGLTMWALNALPYLYLEYDGLINRPQIFREDKKNIPGSSVANYRFGLYMLLCGGMSFFVDVFSSQYLIGASNYQGRQPYMGNDLSAVYLSLVSGGGGHFYRGYRWWGYLYFQVNNILLYYTIKEFSPGERYNILTNSYTRGSINKSKAYTFLGVFGLVKMIEITHALFLKDNIKSGKILEESYAFEPEIYIDKVNGFVISAKYICRF